jgi:hypothetical protein
MISLLGACAKPVKRDANAVDSGAALVDGNANADEAGTLRKRLWVLGFKPAATPEALKEIDVPLILHGAFVEVFSKPGSPFLADTNDDSGLKELKVNSASDPAAIQQIARGSGTGGYLLGEISELVWNESEAPEGILRSKSTELRLGITFRLKDALSGREMFAGKGVETATWTRSQFFGDPGELKDVEQKIREMSQSLAAKTLKKIAPLADKIGWRGRVLKFEGSRVYLNAGRRTGIEVGDILRVVDASKPIVDPQTGALVGETTGRMKATLRIVGHFGIDGSVAVVLSGGGVNVGDNVELN